LTDAGEDPDSDGFDGPERIQISGRRVHTIRIKLHTQTDRSVISWPNKTAKLCVKLMNPQRTGMTARAEHSLDRQPTGKRLGITSIAWSLSACFGDGSGKDYRIASRLARNVVHLRDLHETVGLHVNSSHLLFKFEWRQFHALLNSPSLPPHSAAPEMRRS